MIDKVPLLGVVVAAIGGAAIGVERQRSGHATGARARFGGVRTFTLLGGVAGLAGFLSENGRAGLGVVLAAGSVALVVAGYIAARQRDVDATTEAAALIVIAAGMVAGGGQLALSSGVIAVTVLLLVEKSRLHALVARIDDDEMRAAARFGVMAVVILPLLPEGPFGPWGSIKPRELWVLVLFFTALSFGAYVARRLVGPGRGYTLAGLLGGLISSTNVTFTFARLSRQEQALSRALAVGTIAACTMLCVRVAVAAAVLDWAVAQHLLPYLLVPFAIGAIALAIRWRTGTGTSADSSRPAVEPSNPLQIGPALQMAAVFQIVLIAVQIARHYAGEQGLLVSASVLGLTDVDALTISMTKAAATTSARVAARAIIVGILANTVLKTGLAVAFGGASFRRLTGAVLSAMAVAIGVSLALW